jgi:hypothetical protein
MAVLANRDTDLGAERAKARIDNMLGLGCDEERRLVVE